MKQEAQPSLEQARRYFAQFGPTIPRQCAPLTAILDWIEREDLGSTLYVSAALTGLWISDRPHSSNGDHVLNVTPHGSEFLFFEYHRTHGATDGMRKTVPYVAAVECFRQFLAHKFGVYRAPRTREPIQSATDQRL